tara:strand:- start:506 stop:742 length:237 start_codon:yes stop_codon:yes gene_type:complete
MKLPQNKLARLAINIGFIVVWMAVNFLIYFLSINLLSITLLTPRTPIAYLFLFIPIVLATRYIWWGRIRPRPRITGGK